MAAADRPLVYRHRLPTRLWHWLNALTVFVMLMSGLMIFNAHPRLYWGEFGANPDAAWDFVTYMTSQKTQDAYAKLSLPIWASSYDDPAVAKGQEELIAAAKSALAVMFPRPTTPKYNELSALIQVAIQQVLLATASPADALADAKEQSGL